MEKKNFDWARYKHDTDLIADNIGHVINCLEVLTFTALEPPSQRGEWYKKCNSALPLSDELFPSLLKKHLGNIKMTNFGVSELSKEEIDHISNFQSDCLHHFRQLNKLQILAAYKTSAYIAVRIFFADFLS